MKKEEKGEEEKEDVFWRKKTDKQEEKSGMNTRRLDTSTETDWDSD